MQILTSHFIACFGSSRSLNLAFVQLKIKFICNYLALKEIKAVENIIYYLIEIV